MTMNTLALDSIRPITDNLVFKLILIIGLIIFLIFLISESNIKQKK